MCTLFFPGNGELLGRKQRLIRGLLRLFAEICCVSGGGAGEISCINPMPIVIPSNHESHIIRFIARGIGYGNIYIGW